MLISFGVNLRALYEVDAKKGRLSVSASSPLVDYVKTWLKV